VVIRLTVRIRQALMPYVALLAIVPLGFVLYRRNL